MPDTAIHTNQVPGTEVPEAVDCADDPRCRPLQYERVEPTRALFSASIRKIQSVMAALHNQTIYNAAGYIYMRHANQYNSLCRTTNFTLFRYIREDFFSCTSNSMQGMGDCTGHVTVLDLKPVWKRLLSQKWKRYHTKPYKMTD